MNRTAALALVALALAGCSTPTPAPQTTADSLALVATQMVDRHPACAGRTTTQTDGGIGCAVGGHLYIVYIVTPQDMPEMIEAMKVLHPTGTISVESPFIWVTE